MLVGSDDGGVEKNLLEISILGQFFKHPMPHTAV
jgi:hypothetical protein